MCIIVIKEKDVAMPDVAFLKRCFDANPHGVGYSYIDNVGGDRVVKTKKGYMLWESFLTEYNAVKDNLADKHVVFHFRIATHGKVSEMSCHPFPVLISLDEIYKKENWIVEDQHILTRIDFQVLFHNGMIPNMEKIITKPDLHTDTAAFIQEYLYPLISRVPKWHKEPVFYKFLYPLLGGSRLAIMDAVSDKVIRIGNFTQDPDTLLWVSNNSYMYHNKQAISCIEDDMFFNEDFLGPTYNSKYQDIKSVFSRTPEEWLYGHKKCKKCSSTLIAYEDADYVKCGACGTTYKLDRRAYPYHSEFSTYGGYLGSYKNKFPIFFNDDYPDDFTVKRSVPVLIDLDKTAYDYFWMTRKKGGKPIEKAILAKRKEV